MAIKFCCPNCKRVFRARTELAGRRLPCPACKAVVAITGDQISDYDAFVSYCSADKAIADAIVAGVESAGIRCWIAPRDVPPSSAWASEIINAIEGCRAMVLVYSVHSNKSQQVIREVERALAKGLAVIPFRIDSTPMSKELEYFLSSIHWLDAMDGATAAKIGELTAKLHALLGTGHKTHIELPAPQRKGKRILVGFLATCFLAILLIPFLLHRGKTGSTGIADEVKKPPVTLPTLPDSAASSPMQNNSFNRSRLS